MKLTDLEKNKGVKISSKMKQSGPPDRFGVESAAVPDRREQRKRDSALGLVPFAVKLNGDLVNRVQALAKTRGTGVNEVVAELLAKGLDT